MMQGDSYILPIEILNADGSVVTADSVIDVEITIGFLRKTYKSATVSFDASLGKWLFPITQEESFQFPASRVKAQVRVRWKSGGVEGASLGTINVAESLSKEVL